MNSRYQKLHFFTSAHNLTQLPPDEGREIAFAGRSNSGKSSALNAIGRQKNLARTSKTPGRTQLINFFLLEPGYYLVDLPGYGYAKVPESVRQHWRHSLQRYFNERNALCGLILLMDIRHPLTDLDRQMLAWCDYRDLPSHTLLTKADKLRRGPALATLNKVQRSLAQDYRCASAQLFSSVAMTGLQEACSKLDEWFFSSA